MSSQLGQTYHFYTDLQIFDLQYVKNMNQTSQVLKTCEVYSIFRPKYLFIIDLQIQYIFLIQSNAFALPTTALSQRVIFQLIVFLLLLNLLCHS